MPPGEGTIEDRFLRSLERAPGIRVVDARSLVLQVRAPDDRIVEVQVDEDALLANARLVAEDAALQGLSGADDVDRSFTLLFLHLQAAVAAIPLGAVRRFRYTTEGVVAGDGRSEARPASR